MKNEAKHCQHCGDPFEAKKPWHVFDKPDCKDAHRRQNEGMGTRFRQSEGALRNLLSRLEETVERLAAHRPLLGELVAEVAALHVGLGKLAAFVKGGGNDSGGRADGQQESKEGAG